VNTLNMLKLFIKRFFRHLGIAVRRYQPSSSEDAQRMVMLAAHGVNLVFDVGANTGQFGRDMRYAGYKGRIVSFEPLSTVRKQLLVASRNDPLWKIAPQAAIGNEDGEIVIHVAGNSVSSSVLNMLDAHSSAEPESAYVSNEKVPLRRLDTIAIDYLQPDAVLFIKIDTQGYEDRVLQGASKLLEKAVGVQLELSFVPLYDGQRLYEEMVDQLRALGFEMWAMWPAFVDPRSGRILQADATFFRS
jgi:FkbM family methyltransferase